MILATRHRSVAMVPAMAACSGDDDPPRAPGTTAAGWLSPTARLTRSGRDGPCRSGAAGGAGVVVVLLEDDGALVVDVEAVDDAQHADRLVQVDVGAGGDAGEVFSEVDGADGHGLDG